jgi:hypothetical protein
MKFAVVIVHPGQRVIATDGKAYTVAFEHDGKVFAHGPTGEPYRITVCGDCWGGEHDQTIGMEG